MSQPTITLAPGLPITITHPTQQTSSTITTTTTDQTRPSIDHDHDEKSIMIDLHRSLPMNMNMNDPSVSTTHLLERTDGDGNEDEQKHARRLMGTGNDGNGPVPVINVVGEEKTSPIIREKPVIFDNGPKINLRILVISGQTQVFSFDPQTTIGQVKEKIHQSYPPHWSSDKSQTPCPPSSEYFRILYLGRMLSDDSSLAALGLRPPPAATIMHLSIRTFELEAEDQPKKSLLPFSLRPSIPTRLSFTNNNNNNNNNNQQHQQTTSNSNMAASTREIPLSLMDAVRGPQRGGGGGGNNVATNVPNSNSAANNNNVNPTSNTNPTPLSENARLASNHATRQNQSSGEESHGGGCKCVIM